MDTQIEVHEILAELQAALGTAQADLVLQEVLSLKLRLENDSKPGQPGENAPLSKLHDK